MEHTLLFRRYRLLSRAGAGGSAQVWRARDERTGDDVAVKRLHPVVFADPAARRRLERESHALQQLDSPNIVRIRESRLTDDEAALILDYVAGTSLAERLDSLGALSAAETIAVVRDIAGALTTAHAAGVVHRDVKPANIILADDGRALLTDFGIARQAAAEGDRTATDVTAAGLAVGSLRYMAPEQLRGEPATPASDQFGLAAVAYQMLAGRPPFDAATPVELVAAHQAGPPPLTGVDTGMADAIGRGLTADPAGRYPDVAAFAAALAAPFRPGSAHDPTTVMAAVSTPFTGASAVDNPVLEPGPPARPQRRPGPALLAGVLALGLAVVVALAVLGTSGWPAGGGSAQPAAAGQSVPPSPDGTQGASPTPVEAGTDDAAAGAAGRGAGKDKPGKGDGGNGKGKGRNKD